MSVKSLVKNTTYMYIGEIISNIFQLAFIILLTRYLGAEGIGKLSLALSLGWIIVLFSDFGVNHIMFREMVLKNKNILHHLSRSVALKIFLGITTILVTILLAATFRFSMERTLIIIIICISLILDSTGQLFRNALISIKKMNYESITKIIFGISKLILFLILWRLGAGIILMTSIYATASLITFCFASYFLTRNIGMIRVTVDKKHSIWLLKEAYPLLFGAFAMKMLLAIDVIMLTWLYGDYVTGLYSAPSRLMMNGFFLAEIIIASSLPYMAEYLKKNKSAYTRLGQIITSVYLILIIPVIIASTVFPARIVVLIFGNEFFPGAPVLTVFSFILALYFFSALYHTIYTLAYRVKRLAVIMVSATIINIVLNYILILKYSFMGAAVATTISFSIMVLAEYIILRKDNTHIKLAGIVSRILLMLLILLAIAYFISGAPMLLIIIFLAPVYCILIIFFRIIPKDDLILLLDSLKLHKVSRKINGLSKKH